MTNKTDDEQWLAALQGQAAAAGGTSTTVGEPALRDAACEHEPDA